ncbi:hypothetical protein GJ744_012267 [Endocarpon pusillum]|uniref:Uncharacterized protein n=1 Tax=Endocarpon pusillum TaxID=364733 RepID=A0A8H7AFD6_9EURO|nr:hypothetical protein GJ744_012267 [Endocarpon pusillum]
MKPDSKLFEAFQDMESYISRLVINYFKMVNTRANKYPSLDSPRTGFKRSAKAAGLVAGTRTDHGANKATRLDSQDSARAGTKQADEEAAVGEDVRTDNVESQVALLQPEGARDLGAASSELSMADLGSFPTLEIVGRAKATLANVLSARFPEIRRSISRDLNLHDGVMMLLTCHNLRVSINSQDHLKPFSQYFSARCEVQIPMWKQCLYTDKISQSIWRPCPNKDVSHSIIKLCEGPRVLKKAPCDGKRGVCEQCATGACAIADPGDYPQTFPNFGVTPLCGACPISRDHGEGKNCKCTGLPLAAGEKHAWDLWLCLECRMAYNVEKAQFADDMARAYLYMEKNKHTNTLEYLPNAKISSAKLPTCPCGNEMLSTKIKFRESVNGMCVWCGGWMGGPYNTSHFPGKTIWYEGEGPVSRSGEFLIANQVIPKEALIAIHNQIKQKGLPPPLPKGANKYWSYASVTDEPRLLPPDWRQKYENERRWCRFDRERLNWDDREGFLRKFNWAANGAFNYSQPRTRWDPESGIWKDKWRWRRWEPKDPWREENFIETIPGILAGLSRRAINGA